MKVTFITNAMFVIEGKDSKVLCDPWITFDDKSISGFYNFPKCNVSREDIANVKPDFIYITHTHPDHFDPPTLSLFDKSTPILVAEYKNNFTAKMAEKHGFTDVRIVPSDTGMALNGADWIWIEPAANSPEVDSIAVLKIDGMTALNANDNIFHEGQCERLSEKVGGIDLGMLPSGAHGPFPMFFDNFTADEKQRLSEERALKLKNSFVNYIKATRPRWVIPIAGGVICCGEKVYSYKYSGIRGREEVVEYARKNIDFEPIMLGELNSFDFASGERTGTYIDKTYETERDYLKKLAEMDGNFGEGGFFYVAPDQRIDLSRLLVLARKNQRKWQEIKATSSTIAYFFDVGQEHLYRLTLADDTVTRVKRLEIVDERYEIFTLPYELLLGMLTRHFVWSNVNTQYMTFYRHNDDGVDHDLMLLLNYLQV